MCPHSWDKSIAISFALAAAGILACAGALLDAFIPRDSLLGFLAWMAVMGSIAIGTVVGYTWVCDKCENLLNGRLDRESGTDKLNRGDAVNLGVAASPRPTAPRVVGDPCSAAGARQPLACDRHIPLHGGNAFNAARETANRCWHRQ
jgi:hypothetical protein